MKNYESVVIFYPEVEEEVRNGILERLSNLIKETGNLIEIEDWGDKKFAYPIEDFTHGFYYLFKFQAGNELVNEFSRIIKIQETIIRHMVINLDK